MTDFSPDCHKSNAAAHTESAASQGCFTAQVLAHHSDICRSDDSSRTKGSKHETVCWCAAEQHIAGRQRQESRDDRAGQA